MPETEPHMELKVYAHLSVRGQDHRGMNKQARVIDEHFIHVGCDIYRCDRVFLPMTLHTMLVGGSLAPQWAEAVAAGGNVAIVYYGEDAAGKDVGEFLYQCGKALVSTPISSLLPVDASRAGQEVELSAYGFYRDQRETLAEPGIVARSVGGVHELLETAVLSHAWHARMALGRAHAVFRFEAVGSLSVYVVDGLPNALRARQTNTRITTLLDDVLNTSERPALPQLLVDAIAESLGDATPINVVLHCPLSYQHRYSLVDSLRLGKEIAVAVSARASNVKKDPPQTLSISNVAYHEPSDVVSDEMSNGAFDEQPSEPTSDPDSPSTTATLVMNGQFGF